MATDKRFRMTRQRKIILEELRRMHSHPTADEVYETVRRRMPRISLGTVYRNLEILSQWGLAQKLDLAGARKRFDGSMEDHYHVRCMGCGKVEDVSVGPMQDLEEAVRRNTEFKIVGHRLNFIGFCPTCRRKAEKIPASPARLKPQETANHKQE
jgi:Fur family ferric uptake transcriptional regulator